MDMTQQEIDTYRFKVGRTHFQDLATAIQYAEACLYAAHVWFKWPSGEWKVIWTDGDIVINRPGFGVLVPTKNRLQ